NVKLVIDDNDITIAGHPSDYMTGFDVEKTLAGHGLAVDTGDGEDIDALFGRIKNALAADGPAALVNKRLMAVGVPGIEGVPKGHDVIPVDFAIAYLEQRGLTAAIDILKSSEKPKSGSSFKGSTSETAKNRDNFGKFVCEILADMPDRKERVLVVDSDLEGSCGLHHIRKTYPEVYVSSGIMERNNFSVAAGFGATDGKQGIFGTFSAFLEMVVSEITMARLNQANVLAHFSHAGVDDMCDNTCHFGLNNFFADNGLLENDNTKLLYPADSHQLKAMLKAVFNEKGLRFLFSTRSATPFILDGEGNPFYGGDYQFVSGKDELVREGSDGYVVSYGEMLYRSLDAVERLKAEGLNVGLVNKPTLNLIDEDMLAKLGKAKFVLLVETQNAKTGLGAKMGTWLLERGFTPRYAHMGTVREGNGTVREGNGGLAEQILTQGLGQENILKKIKGMAG
ncbi:MAG: transketolase, partial [Deltaproteobacteria bacterium]|nr:transketolase [Deltaproteobacteria bacterium]